MVRILLKETSALRHMKFSTPDDSRAASLGETQMRRHPLGWLAVLIVGLGPASAGAETVDLQASCDFSGQLRDLNHTTQKAGMAFRVGLRGVSYSGKLTRTLLEQSVPGKVTLWLGLRNVRLSVQRTDINGPPGSAACGPMDVVLGHQQDLGLAFDIEADPQPGSSQMVVRNVRFQLPPENWAIGKPAWVRTAGFGLTQQNVVEGLQQGIAKGRDKIQDRLKESAPHVLSQVVKFTTSENAESPVVQALRARLVTDVASRFPERGASTP